MIPVSKISLWYFWFRLDPPPSCWEILPSYTFWLLTMASLMKDQVTIHVPLLKTADIFYKLETWTYNIQKLTNYIPSYYSAPVRQVPVFKIFLIQNWNIITDFHLQPREYVIPTQVKSVFKPDVLNLPCFIKSFRCVTSWFRIWSEK